MKDHPSSKFGLPEDYDIEETSDSEIGERSAVVKAGNVQTWKPKRITTVPEIRACVLVLCLVLWSLSVVTPLVMAVLTREPIWLTGEVAPALLMKPLMLVLRHYFHRSQGRRS